MPPKRPTSFVPPRPAAKAGPSTLKRKSLPASKTHNSISLSSDDEHSESPTKPDADAANIIPPALLTTIINSHFKESTGIGKDAQQVMAKYIETFVQEAIARAVHERREALEISGRKVSGDFLEVEDLEKIAAQLVLDF